RFSRALEARLDKSSGRSTTRFDDLPAWTAGQFPRGTASSYQAEPCGCAAVGRTSAGSTGEVSMDPIALVPTNATTRLDAAPIRAGEDSRARVEPDTPPRSADTVEFSNQARSAAQSDQTVRQDLVSRVRSEIDAGTYETPEKYL